MKSQSKVHTVFILLNDNCVSYLYLWNWPNLAQWGINKGYSKKSVIITIINVFNINLGQSTTDLIYEQ